MPLADTFLCTCCGGRYLRTVRRQVGESEICEGCESTETVACSQCGSRIWSSDNAGDENLPLCRDCFQQRYTTCICCHRPVSNRDARYEEDDEDEEYPYCRDCFSRRSESIHDYCYKPSPIFYGEGNRFLGVELEIDGGGELGYKALQLMNAGNKDGREHIYCKHDGSLNKGIEIVSHPMTLAYHTEHMPWSDVISAAREMGYTSHKAGTCGLHVHVSRSAFGDTEEKQDACIARILYFFEKHWEELLKFSRRTQTQLNQWAARYGYKTEPREILDHAKEYRSRNRYTCVNLTNAATIEFRMFRGTLNLNSFLAALQFVDLICDVAKNMTDEQVKEMSWTTFASGCDSPELIQYLKERRLYVNEPVESEVEV